MTEHGGKEKTLLTCVVIGDSRVGKSTFIQCATKEIIDNKFSCYSLTAHVDSSPFLVDLWDTRSNNGIRNLQWNELDTSFGGRVKADIVLLIFSCDLANSFKNVDFFVDILHKIGAEVPIILCCTKIDERGKTDLGTISPSMGVDKAKKIKAVAYVECSSISGLGINEVIFTIVRESLIKRHTKQLQSQSSIYISILKNLKLPIYSRKNLKLNPKSLVEGVLVILLSTFVLAKLLDYLKLEDFLSLRLLCQNFCHVLENQNFWTQLCDKYMIYYCKKDVLNFKHFFMKNYLKTSTFVCVPAENCKLHNYTF